MSHFYESRFPITVPEGLIGPDADGCFFGTAALVPEVGWEVQTRPGVAWVGVSPHLAKIWVKARPIPPEHYAVGTVLDWGGVEVTVVATDGNHLYWVRQGPPYPAFGRDNLVAHADLTPPKPPPTSESVDYVMATSALQCAEHLEAGGVVEEIRWPGGVETWEPAAQTAAAFRKEGWVLDQPTRAAYRLVVPVQ